ncbi:MAG: DUF2586 family protein [Bacteroidales bacterium]
MSFEGVLTNKLNGGLNRESGSTERVVVLIGGATATADLIHKKVHELLDIKSAEALGITPANDANNAELTYYDISEMFRLSPGSVFYYIPVDKTTTIADLVADTEILSAIRSINNVNVIGISGIASSTVDVINTDVLALQGMVNSFASEHLLIDGVFLEGRGNALVQDLFDLRTLDAPNISVVIAQDPAQASLNAAYANRAAVGTVLGSVAVRQVHEDIGSVDIEIKPATRRGQENYSLSDAILNRWLSSALSDGTSFKILTSAQQKSLSAKGYIYVGEFADYDGYYLSGCPTAVVKTSDYAYFNYNCIWNKAARIIRRTLIPKVRAKVPTDPQTGFIRSTWIADIEGLCKKRLEAMISAGNAEAVDIYINPEQTISEDKPLSVQCMVAVGQIVYEFSVDIGLTNKI